MEDKTAVDQKTVKEIIGLVEYDVEEGNNIFWGHAKILLEEIERLKSALDKIFHESPFPSSAIDIARKALQSN